jgi:hypothetical protein
VNAIATTNLEKTNLEAHVDLCAERYKHLELRLTTIEVKVAQLGDAITDSKNSMAKVIIGSTTTIVATILTAVITILMKF